MKDPIAIVGSACRFPGSSSSPSKLWDLLRNPRDVLREFDSKQRLNLSQFYNTNGEHHGSTDVPGKSYLLSEDPRLFDASFFHMNPLEADSMDPQQRFLLETVYEALEAAGCTLDKIQGTQTSVSVGVMTTDYANIQFRDTEMLPTYTATGTSPSILSNRISYFFDLKGPSVTVDTACSSSMVAMFHAVQGLRNGDCKQAIVAGSSLLLDPTMYIAESKLHMLSPTSRSRMFDIKADGYARGEGFAALLLKPLKQAVLDGDHIECVIREVQVNSDGRTKGITMPNPIAQRNLIHQTYRNAGLDPLTNRCQYFECHGTGTPAGDPKEAQAIQEAFFPKTGLYEDDEKLYVGSIKTVVGHLEGCAGLAGVLKASLALQNGTLPPNMHFDELNPAIAPFYDHLQVVTDPTPWPHTASEPRRASVNSFGFGGTNAHAILENYQPGYHDDLVSTDLQSEDKSDVVCGPFPFSANTDSSLLATLEAFSNYLKLHPSTHLPDLSYVLQSRRTTFGVKACVSGGTTKELVESLDKLVENSQETGNSQIGTRVKLVDPNGIPGTLGVFTGQGAQWATMGKQLYLSNSLFRQSIDNCEKAISSLPDPPSWSLTQELLADPSRLSEAELSQPLCTALQVALVDLLYAAGVKLDAVVGHSSGEMAATYAAGIISARDAVRIAYYRGLYAKLACGRNGEQGAMMAVSLSWDEGSAFCARPKFAGRISIAASNSPTSLTISGDKEAITEAKQVLDQDGIFARVLKVDTAYHCHHMKPCAEPYLRSLEACDIQVHPPRSDCVWISSVRGDADLLEDGLESLTGQYWVNNMLHPVLFSYAVETSLWNGGPFDIALEVGPHPALKGPATQTIKSLLGSTPSYFGVLSRGQNDVTAFSATIGSIWSHLGSSSVNFDRYRESYGNQRAPKLLKGLPSYSWDHDKVYWKESRVSQNFRLRDQVPHRLLGRRAPDDSDYERRWRNVFRQNELPWTRGHQFQHQVIFPAAGYVSMAIEAAMAVAESRPVKFVEVCNLSIPRGLVIDEGSAGVETVFTVKLLNESALSKEDDSLEAEFACYMCTNERNGVLLKACDGRFAVHFGDPLNLPQTSTSRASLMPVDIDRFYENLSGIGLDYSGIFRTLKSAGRVLGRSRATASWDSSDLDSSYKLHPAMLDVGFQAGFAAFSSPATDILWTAYLPSTIRRIVVDPNVTFHTSPEERSVTIDAYVNKSSPTIVEIDVSLSSADGSCTGVQVEGLTVKSFVEPGPSDDRLMFAEELWDLDISFGVENLIVPEEEDPEEIPLLQAMQRTAVYYFQLFKQQVRPEEVKSFAWFFQRFYEAIDPLLEPIREGKHAAKPEWLNDSFDQIMDLKNRFPKSIDLDLLHAAGKNLVPAARGERQILECIMENNMLQRLYTEGHGFRRMNVYLSQILKQITHKYPRLNILEIGAGTGGTTKYVFDAIDDRFLEYTYTDISAGFFEKAADRFKKHSSRMVFKVLDVERDPGNQGYTENSYDLIIAANVLHATRTMTDTMRHARKLLKPGGYLLLLELSGNLLQMPVVMGGLSGWWLGVEEGRRLGPWLSPLQWENLLNTTGFSGIDYITYDMQDPKYHSGCLIVSQATDDIYESLRDPLSSFAMMPKVERLVIIGGQSLLTSRLIRVLRRTLAPMSDQITDIPNVTALNSLSVGPRTSFICLMDLDEPVFADTMTPERLESLQDVFAQAHNVLWITGGRRSANPHSNMMVGIGRTLLAELPHVNLQFLDFEGSAANPRVISETFVRLAMCATPEYEDRERLWVSEPEILFDGSRILVPRIYVDDSRNNRFNASRRQIASKNRRQDVPIQIKSVGETLQLVEGKSLINKHERTSIEVKYSTPVSLPGQPALYLCFGHILGSEKAVLALSESASSIIQDPLSHAVFSSESCNPAVLVTAAYHFVAQLILSIFAQTGAIALFEPERELANAVLFQASQRGKDVCFISTKGSNLGKGWITIHPQASKRTIQQLLPRRLKCFLDLSTSSTFANIRSCLPQAIIKVFDPLALSQRFPELFQSGSLAEAHRSAVAAPLLAASKVIPIADLPVPLDTSQLYSNVLDWSDTENVTAHIQPLDKSGLFCPTKTYFMVGLTGDLGQSLCRFMFNHGAVHFVLSSRSANVDEGWLDEMHALGANIQVYKMDVTDRESVKFTVETIKQTMPPIGGVCNGAMVLLDKTFINTDVETVNRQLKPKVDGSKYLDEIFSDEPLDFFVLFASLASITGNGGQSIYHAANLFMSSLAAQRRAKGLAASVIWIGMLVDIGYIARRGRHLEDYLRKQFYRPLAEPDLHQLFAEAVVSGRPGSSQNSDIIFGINQFVDSASAISRPLWYSNPRFSHLIIEEKTTEEVSQASSTIAEARQKLEHATTEDIATEAVQELLLTKVEAMMQLPSQSINANSSLLDLGCDSLLAVELRTWILKEVNVDVPILRILGQESVADICADIARKFLQAAFGKSQQEPQNPQEGLLKPSTSVGSSNISVVNQDSSQHSEPESMSTVDDTPSVSSKAEDANPQSLSFLGEEKGSTTDPPAATVAEKEDSILQPLDQDAFQCLERLSFAQSRIWFLSQYLNDPTTYNIAVTYDIKGNLRPNRFAQALQAVVHRHSSLRTCFFIPPGGHDPVQGLRSSPSSQFRHITSGCMETVNRTFEELSNRTWRLDRGEVFETALVTLSPDHHVICFGYHHIIMDGFSWALFLQDLELAYQTMPFTAQSKQYIDFAVQQRRAVESGEFKGQVKFWQDHHSHILDPLPLLPFAKVKSRKEILEYDCHTFTHEIDSNLNSRVNDASRKLRVTPFHFHLTVAQVLIAKLLNIQDMCIGVADANRSDEEYKNTMGFLMNLLPLRFKVSQGEDFSTLAKKTFQIASTGLGASKVPFDVILDKINIPRSSSYSPLFQVAFNYRAGDMVNMTLGDCSMELIKMEDAKNPYDFAITVTQIPSKGTCGVQITTRDYLYSPETGRMLMDMYSTLLDILSNTPLLHIQAIKLYPSTMSREAIELGRGQRVEPDWPDNLPGRFDIVQERYKGCIAVKDDTGVTTYEELSRKVQSLAATLLELDIVSGSSVGVLCEPSIDTVTCMLAILRIGGVYVPLDANLPPARQADILSTCKPKLLLCHSRTTEKALSFDSPDMSIFNIAETPSSKKTINNMSSGSNPAFLLFTSGSTGKPKGISLPQKGYMNYAFAKSTRLSLGQEIVLQQSSSGFDMSIAQVFNALVNGGTLIMVPQSSRGDPVAISQIMVREKVTFTLATPSEYLMLLRYGRNNLQQTSSWRNCCFGGEIVSERVRSEFRQLDYPGLVLTDCYGPTEISAATTFETVSILQIEDNDTDDYFSVGKPICNTSIYIVDEEGNPLPTGYPGEICVGGIGVALGYQFLNQSFVNDPFASAGDISKGWTRMYKTGDQGKLLADGSLVFMGRLENNSQVKLRGLRIELDEIAGAVIQQAGGKVSDAVISVREENETELLVAHVVLTEGVTVSEDELRQLPSKLPLPQYMHPAAVIPLDRLPTTPSGKVDRKALLALALPMQKLGSQPQSAETLTLSEGELQLIWQEVLPQTESSLRLAPDSDFFMAGGSSLLLVRLQGAIKERIGVSLPLKDLYRASTLKQMAVRINSARGNQIEQTIDWEAETAVPEELLTLSRGSSAKVVNFENLEILLTGATTFMGSALLKALVEVPNVRRIHCISVTADSQKSIAASDKVVVYRGSIMDEDLGLSSKDYDKLQENVDQIIHAGSSGHCLNNYSSVRKANLVSTQFLARFALKHRIPLHFLSSNRVTLLSGNNSMAPVSASAHLPPTDGSEGFTGTKWASERFLENLVQKAVASMPVHIHRPCAVIGDSAPSDDAQNALIRYSILLRAVPKLENMDGYLDFKNVDLVAGDIIEDVMAASKSQVEKGRVTFRHHSSGVKVPVSDFRQRMETLYGGSFAEISQEEWLEKAAEMGMEPLIISYFQMVVDRGAIISFPFLGETITG